MEQFFKMIWEHLLSTQFILYTGTRGSISLNEFVLLFNPGEKNGG